MAEPIKTFSYKNFQIEFDDELFRFNSGSKSYTVPLLTSKVKFKSFDNFQFEIYKTSFLHKIGKFLLGFQDITIGIPDFDKRFVVKSNDTAKIKELLSDKEIRNLINILSDGTLQISPIDGFQGEPLPDDEQALIYFTKSTDENLKLIGDIELLFSKILDFLTESKSIKL